MRPNEINERQKQLLKNLYELANNAYLQQVYVHTLGQQPGLNTVQYQRVRDERARLALELEEAGYVKRSAGRFAFFFEGAARPRHAESRVEGFGYLSLTDEGRSKVEENFL